MLPNCGLNGHEPPNIFLKNPRPTAAGFLYRGPDTAMASKTKTKKTTQIKKRPAKKAPARKDPRRAIDARAIIDALEQHVLGAKKMTSTQVSAALALLKKTLPDLAAQTADGAGKDKEATRAHEDALRALE